MQRPASTSASEHKSWPLFKSGAGVGGGSKEGDRSGGDAGEGVIGRVATGGCAGTGRICADATPEKISVPAVAIANIRMRVSY